MDEEVYKYKSNERITKVPSCTFEISYFKKLFEILNNVNKEGCAIELNKLDGKCKEVNVGLQKKEFEKLKNNVSDGYRIHVEVVGTKGEFITSDSSAIFEEASFPDFVRSIRFDNSFFYERMFKRKPLSVIDVQLDFSKPPLIDFVSSPSYPTVNNSVVHVLGENETWVEGSHEKVMSSLRERKNSRSWLHMKNVYDLFLWLLVIPLSLWNLRKFDLFASEYLAKYSSVLTVGIYVYIFVVILNVFRFAFNYLRWLFPYLELKTSLRSRVICHRIVFVALTTAIGCTLAKDLFVWVVRFLF